MPITVRDMIAESAELEVRCLGCGRITIRRGLFLLQPLGLERTARDLQARMRCQRCGSMGQLLLRFPSDALEREREARHMGKRRA